MKNSDFIKLDCKSCKKCCSFPKEDLPNNSGVNLTVAEEKKFGKKNLDIVEYDDGFACEMYGENGCTLTAKARPLQCRIYPLIPSRNGGVIVATGCPGSTLAMNFDLTRFDTLSKEDRSRLATLAEGPVE